MIVLLCEIIWDDCVLTSIAIAIYTVLVVKAVTILLYVDAISSTLIRMLVMTMWLIFSCTVL